MSEYDPLLLRGEDSLSDDLERVQRRFSIARKPYLNSPIPWLIWAIVLPGAALGTELAMERFAEPGVLMLWSVAVLIGGLVEGGIIMRRRRAGTTPLAAWALRLQGNQSMIGLALSIFLIWQDLPQALPAVWLLLIGHSFFLLGGLAFPAMRQAGVIYEVGGLIALWPGPTSLVVFALATGLGNLRVAVALMREGRDEV
jgi:hypothetical protein